MKLTPILPDPTTDHSLPCIEVEYEQCFKCGYVGHTHKVESDRYEGQWLGKELMKQDEFTGEWECVSNCRINVL